MLAVLEGGREEIPKELERLLAEAARRGPVDGRIVLVYQDDRLLAVVRVERSGEDADRPLEVAWGFLLKAQLAMERPRGLDAFLVEKHRLMAIILVSDGIHDHVARLRPVGALRVLERDVQDGILPLLGTVLDIFPNLRALEEVCVRLLRLLKERVQHLQRKRLAEPARSREERNSGLLVKKAGYELRLVGRPVAVRHRRPVAVADWKRDPLRLGGMSRPVVHWSILYQTTVRRATAPTAALGKPLFCPTSAGRS